MDIELIIVVAMLFCFCFGFVAGKFNEQLKPSKKSVDLWVAYDPSKAIEWRIGEDGEENHERD